MASKLSIKSKERFYVYEKGSKAARLKNNFFKTNYHFYYNLKILYT